MLDREGVDAFQRRIWQAVAFCGRYGHQSAREMMRLPVTDLRRLAKEIGTLITEEGQGGGGIQEWSANGGG